MIFKIQVSVALRDYGSSLSELRIRKPREASIDITLGQKNSLWGSPADTTIIYDEVEDNFFDKNGDFNYQYTGVEATAVFFEIESGYVLEGLNVRDPNIQNNVYLSEFSNSKNSRLIYAFFLQPGQILNLQGKKVSDQHIKGQILAYPDDIRLRAMLLDRSKLNLTTSYSPESLLSANEFATYLKMHIRTFQNKLSKGEILGPKKIAGANRWLFKDILIWVSTLSKT